jgi:ElaB/YqjD/DUF883 family membrane-anchored ribosome-binding protein
MATTYNDIRTAADRASDQLSGAAHAVKGKVENFGRRATDKLNETRCSAAGGLENAASKLAATAKYMRRHDVKDVVTGFEQVIRNNPARSLITAVFAGFIAGRLFRGR